MNLKNAGRKPLGDILKRNKNVKIRLSDWELSRIQQLYGHSDIINRSELLREILLKRKIEVKVVNPNFLDTLRQLKGLVRKADSILNGKSKQAQDLKPVADRLRTSLSDMCQQMEQFSLLSLEDLKEVGQINQPV